MELDVSTSEASVVDNVETVEVISGAEDGLGNSSAAATLIDQHMAVANPQEILVPTTEVQIEGQTLTAQTLDQALMSHGTPIITIPVGPPSPGAQQMLVGTKRSQSEALTSSETLISVGGTGAIQLENLPVAASTAATQPSPEIPRKKSRNYLDSHKTIEKKRRDRINSCLEQLKTLVPDCRQYGSKKLDKAEILEMSIEYIQRMQTQGLGGRNATGIDMNINQREWANDLTTWVIQNKILHTGANALDQFCQSLLLHLQSMGSGNALASATSMLLNQANAASNSDEDALFRQQTANAQAALLQQIQQQQQQSQGGGAGTGGTGKEAVGGGANQTQSQQQIQQAQLTQLQALLLLQQQQQLLNQQQQQETDAQSQQTHLQQLQQLQQLQALLLQHIANEASANTSPGGTGSTTTPGTAGSADPASNRPAGDGGSSQAPGSKSDGTQTSRGETTIQVDDGSSVLTGSNRMTSEGATSATLSADHPPVELTQASEEELGGSTEETVYTSAISHMWSSAGSTQAGQSSSLLMLGGGSESEGEGVGGINGRPGGKSSLIETSEVQEEVVLLSQQEH